MGAKGGAIRMSQADVDAHQARIVAQAKANIAAGLKASPDAAPSKQTATQRIQALGRLPRGTMNKTEARFGEYLDRRKLAGEVVWWKFEGVKLMIGKNVSITIDFFLMLSNGQLQAIDVKAVKQAIQDDAHAKTKCAASMYPWPFFYAFPKKPAEAGWEIVEVAS